MGSPFQQLNQEKKANKLFLPVSNGSIKIEKTTFTSNKETQWILMSVF